jgi:hypothetical protein
MRFPDIIVFLLACYDYPVADLRSYANPVGLSITQLVLHAYSTDNPIKAMSACIIKAMPLSIVVIGDLTNSLFCT